MIGKALKLVRQFHDVSQTKLASDLGISNSYLSEIESGKKEPSLEFLTAYAKHFDMPASSILMFSEHIEDSGRVRDFRKALTSKALRIFEWISVKNGQDGTGNLPT